MTITDKAKEPLKEIADSRPGKILTVFVQGFG